MKLAEKDDDDDEEDDNDDLINSAARERQQQQHGIWSFDHASSCCIARTIERTSESGLFIRVGKLKYLQINAGTGTGTTGTTR
jgi:hypothetical protein